MSSPFQHQITAWQVFLLGCLAVWLCLCAPGIVWAETAEQEEKTIIDLKDGTVIELTEDTVIRKGKSPDIPDSTDETVLWSISAKKPQFPLEFENSQGLWLVLYFVQKSEHYGEFHAARVEDKQEQWVHPVWIHKHMPVSPVWVKSWIYFGQGAWLEKMSADDGRIVKRYPTREPIKSLKTLLDDAIEVHIETEYSEEKIALLRFQEGQFRPHIVAPGNLLASLGLWKRAHWVMEDFDYYLDLHRIQEEPLSPEFVIKWRDFDLQEAEKTYRRAYQEDPMNPYFAFYLALCLYYQGQETEATSYFQEALKKSADFWEESLHLGGFLCESLRLTQWADAFYAQGAARYFQEAPAPPQKVNLIEVLIHFEGQRQSAAGQLDRALHVLEVRRQIFPYTEGDNLFSRKYVRWLRRMGQEDKATLEEQRIGHIKFFSDFEDLTPFSFVGFMIAGSLVLLAIIAENEIRQWRPKNENWRWYEELLIVFTLMVIGGMMLLDTNASLKSVILLFIMLVYIGVVAFFRKRWIFPSSSQWHMMLSVMVSSYIVIPIGLFVAHTLGNQLGHSPLAGKAAELLCILVFIGLYYLARRRFGLTPSLRNFKLFILIWVLLWGQIAWFHYYLVTLVAEVDDSLPSIDRGHPSWLAQIDRQVENAQFQTRDLMFIQAVFHQLSGDVELARQVYENIPNDARALNNLGVMALDDNLASARKYFEQALKLDPDFVPAIYNLRTLTNNDEKIEHAKYGDLWRMRVYQRYAPDKPWITIPTIRECAQAEYWSQGGFLVRGFVESPFFTFTLVRSLLLLL